MQLSLSVLIRAQPSLLCLRRRTYDANFKCEDDLTIKKAVTRHHNRLQLDAS